MKIYNDMDQNSDEWFEIRRGKVTGSRLGKVLTKRGTARKIEYYEIIAERISIPADGENPMERGHRLEPLAIQEFESMTGKSVSQVGFCTREDNPNIAISPDGLIENDGKYTEAVEVKCLSSAKHLKSFIENKIPSEYMDQALQYFIVNDDLKTLYFSMYDPRIPSCTFFYIELTRDELNDEIEKTREAQIQILKDIEHEVSKLTF